MSETVMKIGTRAKMVNCAEAATYAYKVWLPRSEPWPVSGTPCVLLESKSCGFAVYWLETVADPVSETY